MCEGTQNLLEPLDMLETLRSCIGKRGPYIIMFSSPFKDNPCKVVNEKGENKIILGDNGTKITVEEICTELYNLRLQVVNKKGDNGKKTVEEICTELYNLRLQENNNSCLYYKGIKQIDDTTFEMIWGF